jgi:dual specificity MAP kinase phosphatase
MVNKLSDFYRHATGRHGFDYSKVEDDIYLGTNACCQFGFERELLSQQVTADISLEGERIDAPDGVAYFLWLPTVDGTAPSPEALEQGVQAITLLRAQGIKMYIHCKNGHGRSTTLLAAYLIRTGMSVDDAVAAIKRKRPSIHLTPEQVEALKRFQQTAPQR